MESNSTYSYFQGKLSSKKVRVWGKGQLTIPAAMREKLGINEDTILDIHQVGNSLIITREKSLVSELAGEFNAALSEDKLDLKDLLCELRENSHEYEAD
jgi:AbrB family looped-hinge helix DNA binding protein